KPGARRGIYVLRFRTEEIYAGQAIDVTRRYVQHCKFHDDIVAMTFREVTVGGLNEHERKVIWELEQHGLQLRNITFTSIPKGESDFDLVMSAEEQQAWLSDVTTYFDGPDRVVDAELRRKYLRKFNRFEVASHSDVAVRVLRRYVRVGIPATR